MNCQKCGKEIADGLTFCNECQNKVVVESAAPVVKAAPSKKKRNIIISVIVAFVLLIVTGVIVFVLGVAGIAGFKIFNIVNTPEVCAEKYVTCVLENDVDGTLKCLPDFMIDWWGKEYNLYEPTTSQVAEAIKNEQGDTDDVYFRIISSERKEASRTAEICKSFGATDEDIENIHDICTVEVTTYIDGERKIYSVLCIQTNGAFGKWYALLIE